jgi:clan AA aspartic protease (TIGR02281 family)
MRIKHATAVSFGFLALIWASAPSTFADTFDQAEFDQGVDAFRQKDYRAALDHFDNVVKANPYNCNAMYYKGVVMAKLGLKNQAVVQYATLIKYYPNTEAAKDAEAALAILNPGYLKQLKPQPIKPGQMPSTIQITPRLEPVTEPQDAIRTAGDDVSSLPKRSKIYFDKEGKNLLIDASINGRPIKMLFDSGAEHVSLGKNHLAELGIRPPETPPIGKAYGIGDGGAQAIWVMRVTLRVGEIERKNFPITVQEDMPTRPLLGQNFFKQFLYDIDNGAKTITFTKKETDSTTAARDPNVIPFTRDGNEIVVQVEVNGRTIPMYLDTGSEQIFFTADQARTAGLEIPDDAQSGYTRGIAGKTKVKAFVVPRIRCGPIIKNDVTVLVGLAPESEPDNVSTSARSKREGLRYPLLGQEFFGDIRVTVDNQANVVRMRR